MQLNKAQKLVKMVELMQRRGGVRAEELLVRFDIDPRTLRRYLSDLRGLGLLRPQRGPCPLPPGLRSASGARPSTLQRHALGLP